MTTTRAATPLPRPPRPYAGADLVIVNEQIGDLGGTERIIAELVERYPRARVLAPRFEAAVNAARDEQPDWFAGVEEIRRASRKRHHLAPLYARWIASAPVRDASLVLSFTHNGWSAAAPVPPGARHLCYSAGVPGALYDNWRDYASDYSRPARLVLRGALPGLRAHHRRMLRRPDRVVTNSHVSAAALAEVLGFAPEVIHPPVRTGFFTPAPETRRHFLVVARVTPQKRVDVAIEAFRGLRERLVIAGGGPWLERLRARAPANVELTGYVPDDELRRLYRASHAVICPSVEDFGIVMAEAHATATPVVAPRAGGAIEIVRDGETGLLLDRAGAAELRAAVRELPRRRFDPAALRASAERFSTETFLARMGALIAEERARASASRRASAAHAVR